MTKTVYILKNDDGNDFCMVYSTIEKAIKALEECLHEDYISLSEEEKKEIKKRANSKCAFPFLNEDITYTIMSAKLD